MGLLGGMRHGNCDFVIHEAQSTKAAWGKKKGDMARNQATTVNQS